MIFSLMGGELDEFADTPTSAELLATNQTYANVTMTAFASATVLAYDDVVCSINNVTNATTTTQVIGTTNYTQGSSGVNTCYLMATDAGQARFISNGTSLNWNVSYSASYDVESTASGVMSNTTQSLTTVADWFPLFIVITAMVVLILLTVIIISTIRGSGLIAGGSKGGNTGGGGSA